MKTIRYVMIFFMSVLIFSSCEDYLDKTPAAVVTENDVFSTYASFQGFIDPNYAEIVDYGQNYLVTTMNYGGDTYSYVSWASGWLGNRGDYQYMAGNPPNTPTLFNNSGSNAWGPNTTGGIWAGGWRGIRVCNLALKKMALLTEATEEEKKLLLGQIYFFRAFFHAEILTGYGGMPYVDTVFAATDNLNMPRISYQECTKKIVADYDRAIELLPANWDLTTVGAARPGANTGRITKGAALAYKQKHLLYAASPLMNKYSGNDYTYNVQLSKDAAAAGWAFLKDLVPSQYQLVAFANYYDNFSKIDGTIPWTTETIFQRVDRRYGSGVFGSNLGRTYAGPGRFGGSENTESVNQMYVDKFEMSDGTRYDPAYDSDNTKRWENRDPRFRKNIIIDKEQHGLTAVSVIRLFDPIFGVGGTDKTVTGQIALPYVIKKWWRVGVNTYDKLWNDLRIITPRMRLAEVYLDYAEAVTAAYGPTGTAPGSTITAVDALNVVRARAGMPPVTAAATGYANFMDLVRNERNVELCFEGHYWFDIRRWYIGHLPENKAIIDLRFDKDWTPASFQRILFFTRIFEDPKHYWLPLPRNMTLLYKEMYQNPGWD
jgi:starch-binding outer membrane protein, SusD/RagB family